MRVERRKLNRLLDLLNRWVRVRVILLGFLRLLRTSGRPYPGLVGGPGLPHQRRPTVLF